MKYSTPSPAESIAFGPETRRIKKDSHCDDPRTAVRGRRGNFELSTRLLRCARNGRPFSTATSRLPRASIFPGLEIGTDAVSEVGDAGRDVATVDRDLGAADEARFVRGEKQHQFGAFLGRALAMHWDRRACRMGKGLAAAPEKAGIGDLPRMDRIDPDVPRRELQHRGLGEAAQPPFAGGVGGVVMRCQPSRRRDVDYRAAAAVADRRRAMLHAEHGAGQVDGDRPVPRLDYGVSDALAGDRPGIVYEG